MYINTIPCFLLAPDKSVWIGKQRHMTLDLRSGLFTPETYSKFMAAKPPLKYAEIVDKQTAAESVFQVQADEPSTHQPPELQERHGKHTQY